ncbi:AIF_collapsed_G0053070.mRNA.1.CDS.1 [Saccharomyces cerevisiae]|nr:AIF_collapsed_G0053070.mRNA.1.CDS.1 [Saccharomyces cerevisiae]
MSLLSYVKRSWKSIAKKAEQPHDLSAIRSLFLKEKGLCPRVYCSQEEKYCFETQLRTERWRDQSVSESDADEGWEDIPVYVKAFAEFESKKRLQKNSPTGRNKKEDSFGLKQIYIIEKPMYNICGLL